MNANGLIKQRRFGRFRIAIAALQGDALDVRAVFASCIVTRTEHNWMEDQFEVSAISPQFDPVPEDCIAPEYLWIITIHEPLGQITARAERIPQTPAAPFDLSLLTRTP